MRLFALICLAPLAGCDANIDTPAPEPRVVEAEQPLALALNPALPLADISCTTDRLPVTGACPDGNPEQFLKVDDMRPLFAAGCVWVTKELETAVDEALIFRTQDCSGASQEVGAYAWTDTEFGGQVLTGSNPENAVDPILDVWRLTSGMSIASIATETMSTAPEDQQGRCVLTALEQTELAGSAYVLQPNDDLHKEMMLRGRGDLYDACGVYGVTDTVQMWEARRSRVFFHLLGQGDSEWDPASFTFYRRNGDGTWYRDE
jgi:hypothetical protein